MILRRLAVPLLLAAAPATAQEATEVVVTGQGLAARPGDKAASVVTIDAARIAENASDRLESVLADVAGLQQFRRSDSRAPPTRPAKASACAGSAAMRRAGRC